MIRLPFVCESAGCRKSCAVTLEPVRDSADYLLGHNLIAFAVAVRADASLLDGESAETKVAAWLTAHHAGKRDAELALAHVKVIR